jgi:hypothetical protein
MRHFCRLENPYSDEHDIDDEYHISRVLDRNQQCSDCYIALLRTPHFMNRFVLDVWWLLTGRARHVDFSKTILTWTPTDIEQHFTTNQLLDVMRMSDVCTEDDESQIEYYLNSRVNRNEIESAMQYLWRHDQFKSLDVLKYLNALYVPNDLLFTVLNSLSLYNISRNEIDIEHLLRYHSIPLTDVLGLFSIFCNSEDDPFLSIDDMRACVSGDPEGEYLILYEFHNNDMFYRRYRAIYDSISIRTILIACKLSTEENSVLFGYCDYYLCKHLLATRLVSKYVSRKRCYWRNLYANSIMTEIDGECRLNVLSYLF